MHQRSWLSALCAVPDSGILRLREGCIFSGLIDCTADEAILVVKPSRSRHKNSVRWKFRVSPRLLATRARARAPWPGILFDLGLREADRSLNFSP